MKALAFFMHLKDLLDEIKTPEEWASVTEAISECEAKIAAGKAAAAKSNQPAPAPVGSTEAHHSHSGAIAKK